MDTPLPWPTFPQRICDPGTEGSRGAQEAVAQGHPRRTRGGAMVRRAEGRGDLHLHRGQRRRGAGRARRGAGVVTEPLSFELSRPAVDPPRLPEADVASPGSADILPRDALRSRPPSLPRLSEPEIMRHYSRLASLNYSISENFYPLGSCTMKYNPVVNEAAAAMAGFAGLHA